MAGKHTYKISLDLETSTKTKIALSEMRQALGESGDNIDGMIEAYKQLNSQVEDGEALARAVDKEFNKRIGLYDREIDALIKELETRKDLSEEEKKAKKDRIKELSDMKKKTKIQAVEFKARKGIKDEILKGLKEQVKQSKLIQTLTDNELKTRTKIAKLIASGASKLGKAGAGIAGAAIGGAMALGGAALAQTDNIVNKADALKSLREGIDGKLVDDLYVKTGADYSTIIAAINRVASISGVKDVARYAEAEVKNPGTGLMMASQSKVNAEVDYTNIFDQIRKKTGIQDTSQLLSAVRESTAVRRGMVSQKDFMLAYASLSQAGLGEEDISRIINRISRQNGDFIENFNNADLSSMVYGAVKRNTLKNQEIKLERISDEALQESDSAKKARELQERLRAFEVKKDEIMMNIFEAIEPHAQDLVDLAVEALKFTAERLPGILDTIEAGVKIMADIPDAVEDAVDIQKTLPIWSNLAKMGEAIGALAAGNSNEALSSAVSALNPFSFAEGIYNKATKAQGGLVTSPSICGEAGPELVLPLNNPYRAQNIVNNYTNTNNFSMSGNQTALSISQAISNNKFIRHASKF